MIGLSMGHRYSMIMICEVKRALHGEMPDAMRLDFLSQLEKMVDGTLTAEVIALIEPMEEQGMELMKEARKLGYGPTSPNLFTVLDQKFDVFAQLNPSLVRAYDAACLPWGGKYEPGEVVAA